MDKSKTKLEPLKITCTSTDCASNLHCFKFHNKKMTADKKGACRSCGIKLVDWNRVHKRNIKDIAYTFKSLKFELIRHHNWHIDIDLKAMNHARRKGKKLMRIAAEKRIRSSVAPANPPRDGTQTPREGNIIYYAQHGTACCCRKCIEYWHDIPQGRELNVDEIQYFTDLILDYLRDRLPDLKEDGVYVPKIKS